MSALTDNFTDTDGTLLSAHTADSGHTWTQHAAFAGTAEINGNRLRSTSNTRSNYYSSDVPSSANYIVTARLRKLGSAFSNAGVFARMSTGTPLNTYGLAYFQLSNEWRLIRTTNGTQANLATYSQTFNLDEEREIELRVVGDSVKGFIDGVERLSATDGTHTAAGRAGVWVQQSQADGISVDWIQARPITLERSAALSGSSSIASVARADKHRQAELSATGAVAVEAERDHLRSVAIAGATDVNATGAIEGGFITHERTVSVAAAGAISADGLGIVERSAALAASAGIATAAAFWTIIARSAALSGAGALTAAHQRALLRSVSLAAVAQTASAASVERLRAASLGASGEIASSGRTTDEFERSAILSAAGLLSAAGIAEYASWPQTGEGEWDPASDASWEVSGEEEWAAAGDVEWSGG